MKTNERKLKSLIDSGKTTEEIAKEFAACEISRLLDHLDTLTSNESWVFSMDLGGATESGFAWQRCDTRYDPEYDTEEEYIVAEGKDTASLLKYLRFDEGKNREEFWKQVEIGKK